MYDIGDLIFRQPKALDGQLVCDGGQAADAEWPELAPMINTADIIKGYDFSQSSLSGMPNLSYPSANGTDLSKDGSKLAVSMSSAPAIIDTTTWTQDSGTPSTNGYSRSLSFGNISDLLALCDSASPYLHVFDTNDWSAISTGLSLSVNPSVVRFNHDDTLLAAGFNGTTNVVIYDTSSWLEAATLSDPAGDIEDLAFSPDGQYLAVACLSSPGFLVYATSDWSLVASWGSADGFGTSHYSVKFNHDGSVLAMGHEVYNGGNVTLVDTSDWLTIITVSGLADKVEYMDFSMDDLFLAVSTSTTTPYVQVIDMDTHKVVADKPKDTYIPTGIAFTTNGNHLIVVSYYSPRLAVFPVRDTPPVGYFYLPDIPNNPVYPDFPVLIQAE